MMYLFESPVEVDGARKEVLVVFSGQLEGGEFEYSQLIERGFRQFSIRPEEVLFVYPSYLSKKINDLFVKDGRCYRNISRYGDNVAVSLLAFDVRGDLTSKTLVGRSSLTHDLVGLRDQVVDRGLFNLARMRKDQVIQKAPSGTVFSKPSGDEYDEFIQAGELAVGYSENQFVAFCLLSRAPKGREVKTIYIDTNSISSFIESLTYYWMRFSASECKPAVYHSYGSYGGRKKAKPDDSENIWVIVSASRSNNMGVRMAEDWSLADDQIITLLSYADTQEERVGDGILVNISALSQSAQEEALYGSLIKVKVVGENFTVEVEKPNPVTIKAEHKTAAISRFIVPNRKSGLFSLHKTHSANNPVKPIYIEFEKLQQSNGKYISWLNTIIDWYVDFPEFTRRLIALKCNSTGSLYERQALH